MPSALRRIPRSLQFPLAVFLIHSLAAAPVQKLRIPMRDGVPLATDVYLPDGEGPWPAILLRFPYNKDLAAGIGPEAAAKGYAFVAQDTRGRFASEGENLPFDADGRADGHWDGHDTVTWMVAQPWSNGRVGTWGASAGAITQYLLAGAGHTNVLSQHLVVGNPGLFEEGIYRGGIFRKAMIEGWLTSTRFATNALDLWTTNYPYTRYWKDRGITDRYPEVRAAGLHIGGWHDIFARGTIDAFRGYQHQGGPGARGRQRLVMGPWTHGVLQEKVGDLTYPGAKDTPGSVHDQWAWFNATLKGDAGALPGADAVTYYVMGASGEADAPGNQWRTAGDWPPPSRPRPLHLRPDRSAAFEPHGAGTATLSYRSDPTDPVPSVGGYELTLPAGPRDQRAIEDRGDLLVFTSEPLRAPLEVTGDPVARIVVSASAPDADLIIRLCDVYPDGRSYNVCEGALRLRLRHGMERPTPLTRTPEAVRVPLWPTSIVFNRGHRIRVHVASSSAPALEPNLQNGLAPRTGDPQPAEITVHFDGAGPVLELPVRE